MLPGVVRGPDGRLRIKGGQPTQGALQVSSASLVDPSTGDFDLQLPGQSVESVEVLANPFAAEYGRFSTSVTQIRTRARHQRMGDQAGQSRAAARAAISAACARSSRACRFAGRSGATACSCRRTCSSATSTTPVRSLPDEPEIKLKSFDSFTRVDGVISSRHTLGGGLIMFPREVEHLTMNTFRPPKR